MSLTGDAQLAATRSMLERHSEMVEVRGCRLRIISIPHRDRRLPLLLLVHGLGGQAMQFAYMISFFKSRLPLVAVDLVGHGASQAPSDVARYRSSEMAQDLVELIRRYRREKTILVAHSYGTSLTCHAVLHHMSTEERSSVQAIVLCGPTIERPMPFRYKVYSSMPSIFFDLIRWYYAIWGTESPSVQRYVSPKATRRAKELQLEWSMATPSFVVQNTLAGMHRATLHDYAKLACDVLILAGEDDKMTPVSDAMKIYEVLPRPHGPQILSDTGHGMLFEASELVNALVNTFFMKKCNIPELDVAPKQEAAGDKPKWALKNHAKWKATQSAGSVIGRTNKIGGLFGCKVLRQDDPDHSPGAFHRKHPNLGLIIDVSQETPPYLTTDPAIRRYTKVPTQSKVVPTRENVAAFAKVLDDFFADEATRGQDVAVHCHYGFNRTGFMICCYLIERRGFDVVSAVEAFTRSRPPGIKHESFLAEIRARYEPEMKPFRSESRRGSHSDFNS